MVSADERAAVALPRIRTKFLSLHCTGGVLGMLGQRHRLEREINALVDDGYRLRHVMPADRSLVASARSLLLLLVTCGLWTRTRCETLVFEKLE